MPPLKTSAVLLLLAVAACGKATPQVHSVGHHRVVCKPLGLALESVPTGFTASVTADVLRLTRVDGAVLTIARGTDGQASADLTAAVTAEKARLLALPSGSYLGFVELLSHLGRGYLTRGRYRQGAAEMEEIRVFAVHPREPQRAIVLSYIYSASSSSQARADEALSVLAKIMGA